MRKTALLSVLVALWTATPVDAAGSADAVLAEARAALDDGNAAQARHLADEALSQAGLEPAQRARLLLNRGLALELLGDHDGALVDFTAAIDAKALPDSDQAQALLQRGFLLDSMSQLAGALSDYSAVIRLAPGSAQAALNNRANIYRRQKRLKEARRDYLAALRGGNPHPEYPYTGLGQIAEAQGDVEEARRYYAKAVAANIHYGPAVNRLAALGGPPPDSRLDAGVRLRPPGAGPLPVDPPVALRPLPAAPPLRPAIAPSAGRSRSMVQLGAWRSQAEAEAGWSRAKGRAGDVLDGLTNSIQPADLPTKGRFYRLRVAPGALGAGSLCEKLKTRGLDCLIVTN
jgi:tetratricopeptide (TPR) repeat protein